MPNECGEVTGPHRSEAMKITCPNCEASYQLADRAIGTTGRKVRCTRCGTIWHAMPAPPPDEEEALPSAWDDAAGRSKSVGEDDVDAWRAALNEDEDEEESFGDGLTETPSGGNVIPFAAPAGSEGGETEDAVDQEIGSDGEAAASEGDGGPADEASPVIDQEPAGFPGDRKAAARTRKKAPKRKGPPRRKIALPAGISAAVILALTLAAVGAAVAGRETVVRLQPDFAGLYELAGMKVNLRGLELEGVRTFREVDGATPVLVVEGEVENVDAVIRTVPTLRFGLRSAAGREVYAWTMAPAKSHLDPGERLAFSSRLPAPPDAATDVQVRFTDRGGS